MLFALFVGMCSFFFLPKNTLERINSCLGDKEEWTSELEDRVVEITQAEQKKEKKEFKKMRTV